MTKKSFPIVEVTIDAIVGGGQSLGTTAEGKKVFCWGALPGETAQVQLTKSKSSYAEGIATSITNPSDKRVEPNDPDSYLTTSPWQMMDFNSEQHYKSALIEEAFELHDIVLPGTIEVFTDDNQYKYRNKVEFSWYGDGEGDTETLDLAFFRRGSKGKIVMTQMSIARPEIMKLGLEIRDLLRTKDVTARNLKTLLIRADADGNCVWQLYIKDKLSTLISESDADSLSAQGGEVIYSDPKSPASRITQRLTSFGNVTLHDSILDVPFHYAAESFFQGNLTVYEQALRDMKQWVTNGPVLDLYSGVGTIGLTIGGDDCTLVEIDKFAVKEMKRNIFELGSKARAVLAPSEYALEEITADRLIIVDPPRAGLHKNVIEKLLDEKPKRIVYLSCNPVTQARDCKLLCEDNAYGVAYHRGYNFFPRTPHIEHLVVLDLK